jgi:hypothetical protein
MYTAGSVVALGFNPVPLVTFLVMGLGIFSGISKTKEWYHLSDVKKWAPMLLKYRP